MGPGPLRSHAYPMGLPWLKGNDRKKVREGNRLLMFSCRVLWYCQALHIPYVLENPWTDLQMLANNFTAYSATSQRFINPT